VNVASARQIDAAQGLSMTRPLAKVEATEPLPAAIRIRDLYKRF